MPHILRTKHPLTLLLAACGGLLLISAIISSLSPSMSLVDLDSEGTTDSSTSILPSSSPFSTPHKPINNDGDELLNLLQSANALFRKKTLSAVQSSNAKDENAIINGVIMPKMGNTTVREELGRATWRLLHTMASRIPLKPTDTQRLSFELFVYLLSRLYPCGNCASHFQLLLSEKPPAFPSRDASVQWMCETHNIVNKRLNKKEFNCADAEELWKCGCPDSDVTESKSLKQ